MLHDSSKPVDVALKLFGINPIFSEQINEQPLFQKLNKTGTLFIQNVEHLNRELQQYLAEFIRYGYYRPFKSETKIPSNVRIICSTSRNLQDMVHDGSFSPVLFNELKQTTLNMPSLLTLPQDELHELTHGFTEQTLKTQAFKSLLELSDRDKNKIATRRPVSLKDLKHKVHQLVLQKSKENNIYEETEFDPEYKISNPELIEASRLGKHALRDQKIMVLLWNKFKSQTKIATFLGVNRSSVNRRCKDYELS